MTEVTAPCGCPLECDWPSGDRRMKCETHGRHWVVRKSRARTAPEYEVDPREVFPG